MTYLLLLIVILHELASVVKVELIRRLRPLDRWRVGAGCEFHVLAWTLLADVVVSGSARQLLHRRCSHGRHHGERRGDLAGRAAHILVCEPTTNSEGSFAGRG